LELWAVKTNAKTNFLLWEGLRGDVDYRTDARMAMSDNDKTDLEESQETGTEQSDLSDNSTTESESPSDNLDSDTSLSAPSSYETSGLKLRILLVMIQSMTGSQIQVRQIDIVHQFTIVAITLGVSVVSAL